MVRRLAVIQNACFTAFRRRCFSGDTKPYSQMVGGKFVESKIRTKQLSPKAMAVAPPEFPFAIEDDPSDLNSITLTLREVDAAGLGQKIQVEVRTIDYVFAVTYRNIKVYVNIFNQNGQKMLGFELTSSATIRNMFVYDQSISSNKTRPFYCWNFWDMEGSDFERYLSKYLESRGINNSYFEFLRDYMSARAKLQRLSTLTALNKFIQD